MTVPEKVEINSDRALDTLHSLSKRRRKVEFTKFCVMSPLVLEATHDSVSDGHGKGANRRMYDGNRRIHVYLSVSFEWSPARDCEHLSILPSIHSGGG